MNGQTRGKRVHQRWAEFRFSVIGQLLAAPPPRGELAAAIAALAERTWHHPITSEHSRFGFSTIERWYYRALKEKRDPVGVLRADPVLAEAAGWSIPAPDLIVRLNRATRGRLLRSDRGFPDRPDNVPAG